LVFSAVFSAVSSKCCDYVSDKISSAEEKLIGAHHEFKMQNVLFIEGNF